MAVRLGQVKKKGIQGRKELSVPFCQGIFKKKENN
jgi:hypothetical protein